MKKRDFFWSLMINRTSRVVTNIVIIVAIKLCCHTEIFKCFINIHFQPSEDNKLINITDKRYLNNMSQYCQYWLHCHTKWTQQSHSISFTRISTVVTERYGNWIRNLIYTTTAACERRDWECVSWCSHPTQSTSS